MSGVRGEVFGVGCQVLGVRGEILGVRCEVWESQSAGRPGGTSVSNPAFRVSVGFQVSGEGFGV